MGNAEAAYAEPPDFSATPLFIQKLPSTQRKQQELPPLEIDSAPQRSLIALRTSAFSAFSFSCNSGMGMRRFSPPGDFRRGDGFWHRGAKPLLRSLDQPAPQGGPASCPPCLPSAR